MTDGKQSKGRGKPAIDVGPNGILKVTQPNGEVVFFKDPSVVLSTQGMCIVEDGSPEQKKVGELLARHEKYGPKDNLSHTLSLMEKTTWLGRIDLGNMTCCCWQSVHAAENLMDAL